MAYERASTGNTTLSPQSRYQLQSQSKNSSLSHTLSDTSPLQTVEQFTLPHTVRHILLHGGHYFFLTYIHTYIHTTASDAQTLAHSTADADADA
ncbi:hypothetical protein DTO166G4_2250 [Paecilomyces variotii]|nr:hypothetical protein DTO166G4_2250 [Paecilomyces variotii]KAJ9240797.1 hypothetical protein DTO166G5_1606 [Paecilomyces variotii]KAJ9265933.1 hypothetical protein DTO195F2_1535 [Paecilomyces variotii]KAJ9291804.1 hypothetical protein DTO021C3_705 [Paecilomyces variotii]KAJ9321197.1 hypothetical protein DTO027B3_7769 [Paecilomyces variotii]